MSAGAAGQRDRPASLAAVRRLLLRLIGPQGTDPALAPALDAPGWERLDQLAATHRLQPLLAWRQRDNPAIPAMLRERWQGARRIAAARALQMQQELRSACALLEGAGLSPIALKGAWLAWHAWPEPSLRPMRDIDLLLPGGTVLAAYNHLLAKGYRCDPANPPAPGTAAGLAKHMPPLLSPGGLWLELHDRLAEPPGRMDHRMPAQPLAGAEHRAIVADGIRYLAPTDLIAHLAIHAAYDHRLDCGPLLLPDIAFTLAAQPVDWDRFWHDAAGQGWERGARLVLDLVAEYDPGCAIAFPAGQPPTPAPLRELAPDLLLQDLAARRSAGVLAAGRVRGWRGLLGRVLRQHRGGRPADMEPAPPAPPPPPSGSAPGYARWALDRSWRTLRDLARADVRRQSGRLAALSGWLDGAA